MAVTKSSACVRTHARSSAACVAVVCVVHHTDRRLDRIPYERAGRWETKGKKQKHKKQTNTRKNALVRGHVVWLGNVSRAFGCWISQRTEWTRECVCPSSLLLK